MGGDELSLPAEDFRKVYDSAAEMGLHRLVHAGEIGGPQQIRDAIEYLGAERIGHGIAAIHDPAGDATPCRKEKFRWKFAWRAICEPELLLYNAANHRPLC